MASVKRDISAPERLQMDSAGKEDVSSTSADKSGGNAAIASSPETPQDESFKCSGHAEKSLKRMEDFLQAQQLTDVTLLAGSEHIPAHRLVLSASSEYFAAMFRGGLRESNQAEVELQDVDPACLQELVNYCYTGTIELREDTVEVMLATSSLLQITRVTEACAKFLEKRLHPSNCIGISLFADAQSCLGLLEKAHSYTADHFMEVVGSQEFLQLGSEQVGRLLACDDLNVPSEQDILQALVDWVKFSPETRQQYVGELLAHVKLPLLSPSFIADHVEAEPLFADSPQCRELVMEAMKFHLLPERRATLASPRTCPRKSTMGSMYAVGGIDASKGANSLERYDPRADKWTNIASLPGRRLQFGVAILDGKIIVVGGRDGLKTLNVVENFDPVTCAWSSLPGMNTSRHGLGVGVLGGPLYAVGGHDGWSYLNTVERWDPQARQWSYVAPMSTQRSTVGVAVLNDRLYAVGGRDGSVCLRTVECYDPYTNRWLPCAPMTKQRGGVGLAALDGCLYACGGHDAPASHAAAARLGCCERYDPKTDTWTSVAPMSVGRDGIGVGVLGDKLMAVGGYDGTQYLDLVEAYDPTANEWTQVAPMNLRRASTCIIVL